MSDRAITKDLMARLQRHYIKPGPMPGGVFVPECGINGGAQTRADALYVGFTSTSGRILIGHELKASRADWRKELDSAGKADFWADNCHAWYIVAPSLDIVPKEEVPHGWGLMIPNPRTATRMNVVIKAPVRAERHPSWDAVRSILARLDTLQAQQMIEHRGRVAGEERERARKAYEQRAEQSLTYEQQVRLNALDVLERRLGMTVKAWADSDEYVSPEHLAAALCLVRQIDQLPRDGRYLLPNVERHAKAVTEGVRALSEASAAWHELVDGESSERAS